MNIASQGFDLNGFASKSSASKNSASKRSGPTAFAFETTAGSALAGSISACGELSIPALLSFIASNFLDTCGKH